MSSRLIPWCLAATGFVTALLAYTGQSGPGSPELRRPSQVKAAGRPTQPPADVTQHRPAPVPDEAANETSAGTPVTAILPLPPATHPEPVADTSPVADDQPVVEDLPAPQDAREGADGS